MALLKSKWLHGLHEPDVPGGLEQYLDRPSWMVLTEGIGHDRDDTSGGDYTQYIERGFWPIVRLNNGYGSTGTIPLPDQYDNFAVRCANFIRASRGHVYYWIIGNEPNHRQERPNGQPISVESYVDCYKRCYRAIKSVPNHAGDVIMPAPVAMWNVETGPWYEYFQTMLELLQGYVDGIALHTYTHGWRPSLLTSSRRMDPPYGAFHYEFRAYRDLLDRVPSNMRSLPVLITEMCQVQEDPPGWLNEPTGWIQAAYDEIKDWNSQPNTQKIQAAICYRYPQRDQWYMEGKEHVLRDFQNAVKVGFEAPQPLQMHSIFLPTIRQGKPNPRTGEVVEWMMQAWARILKVEVPVLQAILAIESGRSGFLPDGRLKIRFEVHRFAHWLSRLTHKGSEFEKYFRYGDPVWTGHQWRSSPDLPWRNPHMSGAEEWEVLEFASMLDRESALLSTSMGSSQILGSNHVMVGYPEVEDMYMDFRDPIWGDENQLAAMFAYFLSKEGMLEAIQQKRWRDIGYFYNGAGQADYYGKLIMDKYRQLTGHF